MVACAAEDAMVRLLLVVGPFDFKGTGQHACEDQQNQQSNERSTPQPVHWNQVYPNGYFQKEKN